MIATNSVISDADLLLEYSRTGSDALFRELVSRHLDLVYTAARRQVRDPHLADDISQAVFLIMSKRAGSMRWHGSLAGWLLVTTRNVARNAIKHESRLKRREQKVAAMTPENQPPMTAQDESISIALDQAMSALSDADRDVIIQRFFQSKTHREVAAALGVSEEAATKRVARALDKLRNFLMKSGVATSPVALGIALPIIAVKPAPPALAAAIFGNLTATPSFVAAIAKPVLGGKAVTGAFVVWGSAAAMAIAVTAGVLISQNLKSPPPGPPPVTAVPVAAQVAPPVAATSLTVTVIDPEADTPIEGAEVQYQRGGNGQGWSKVDASGKVNLPIPGSNEYVQIIARAPGRAQARIVYNGSPIRGDHPGTLRFPLERGTIIGGVVVDENGEPVPGAQIQLNHDYSSHSEMPEPAFNGVQIATDTDGRWTFEAAPKDISGLHIMVTHPGVNAERAYSQYSVDELRREEAKIVLKKAAVRNKTRTGVVLDPDGKPLSGATVMWYYSRHSSDKPTTKTDAEGKFTISTNSGSSEPIVATAKGYGPQIASREEVFAERPLTLKLTKPGFIQGTVVDENGNPVRGATVESADWRGSALLTWTAKTDADGKFAWHEAPSDPLKINILAANRSTVDNIEIKPGAEPMRVTLYPPLNIEGKVMDAETGELIPQFKMVYGIRWGGQDDVTWQSQSSRAIANGKYEATVNNFNNGGRLRVEADGYLPGTSRLIEARETINGTVTIDFALKKGSGPSGTIVDADDQPVVGALVAMIPSDSQHISLDEIAGSVASMQNATSAMTDRQGKFVCKPLEGDHTLVVSCEQGMAVVKQFEQQKIDKVKLRSWGKIEGTMRQNAGVAANTAVALSHFSDDQFYYNLRRRVVTDQNGRFTITRVPIGKFMVCREHPLSNGTAFINLQTVEVQEGKTVTVEIGGKGRPVVGKLVLPPEVTARVPLGGQNLFSFMAQSQNKSSFNPFDIVEFPVDYADMPSDQRRKWQQDVLQKPKMAAMFKAMLDQEQSTQIQFTVSADGSIRADDVLPGRYIATVDVREPWRPGLTKAPESIVKISRSFDVPMIPKVPTDEPVDLGVLAPGSSDAKKNSDQIKIGNELPAVPLVTLDGKPFDLGSMRGKVVLIHTWHLDGQQMFDAVKQAEDQYASDDRVAVVHVGFQTLTDWAKRIAEKQAWHGVLVIGAAEYQKQYEPNAWDPWQCNYSTPECLVLDREGKLVKRISKPDELKPAIDGLLAKP